MDLRVIFGVDLRLFLEPELEGNVGDLAGDQRRQFCLFRLIGFGRIIDGIDGGGSGGRRRRRRGRRRRFRHLLQQEPRVDVGTDVFARLAVAGEEEQAVAERRPHEQDVHDPPPLFHHPEHP